MNLSFRIRPRFRIGLVFLAWTVLAVSGFAQVPAHSFEGTLEASLMGSLKVVAPDGESKIVVLPPGVIVLRRVGAVWTDIHPGEAIGVDAKRQSDGSLVSVAINIFSESLWKKVQKGQFPMASGDVMTNATVDSTPTSVEGGVLTLKQDGETMKIQLANGVVVHRLLDASPIDLVPGLHLQIRGNPESDGSMTAAVVTYDPK